MEARSEQARLRWRCRRGLRELDLLLDRYISEAWPAAPAAERAEFLRLIERDNAELTALLAGIALPGNPDLALLLARLRAGPAPPSC